jgi:hypothetical protein
MDIDLTGFSAVQQPALFDLLILSMYADGHLTTFEDEQLQKLLATMGFVDEIDRQREFDAAVTRIRPIVQSIHQAKEHAIFLADAFIDRKQQKQVLAAAEQMMTSDNNGCLRSVNSMQVDGQIQVLVRCDPLDLLNILKEDFLPMNLMCERAGMFEDRIFDRTKALFEFFGLPFEGRRPGLEGN